MAIGRRTANKCLETFRRECFCLTKRPYFYNLRHPRPLVKMTYIAQIGSKEKATSWYDREQRDYLIFKHLIKRPNLLYYVQFAIAKYSFLLKSPIPPDGFYWGHQCSWTLTPANSMQASIMQFDNCNRK